MPQFSPETWSAIAVVAALVTGGMLGRVWRPLRKTVAAIDVVTGRPARYPGDPEERPGLAERLDHIDENIAKIRVELDEVKKEVQSSEEMTQP